MLRKPVSCRRAGACWRSALVRALPYTALGLLLAAPGAPAVADPSDAWLRYYGLERWETVLDHDQDGFSAQEEHAFGTNPWDPLSHPPTFVSGPDGRGFQIQIAAGVSYGSADLQTSTDLLSWEPVPGFPPAAPGTFAVGVQIAEDARFYRFTLPGLANSDGDCLTDFEELNLFHTDPLKADTDGDGLDDCTEILVYHTDPTRGSGAGRGAIRGRVMLDEDRDPVTQVHPGIAGWTVFVDLDFDGEWDAFEPRATSQSDGSYAIAELDPGFYRVCLAPQPVWTQVFPAPTPVPTPDGYPDRVVEVFDSGTGPIPFPYGRDADPLPGQRLVFPSPPPDPVDASVILGALPASPIAGPFGGWSHVRILSIPTNSFVTVAFDGEEIYDGLGPDLAIWCAAGGVQDAAELSLGPTSTNLTVVGVVTQEETILVDLAATPIREPVRFVKLRGLGLVGTYPGIDVVGLEALHYRPRTRGHYEVTVVGGQTVEEVNFGMAGFDRPPKVALSTDRRDVRAGESVTVQVTATDDIGVAAVSLTANGVRVTLDAQRQAVVPVTAGGLFTLEASATDTAGQGAVTLSSLIARNEDGSRPDLSGLGVLGGSAGGGPSIQVLSPAAGEILTAPRVMTGSITGAAHGVADWQVHYAPVDAVNPEALDAPDPDYVLLSEGTGPVIQAELGRLAGDTLPAGAYLLRVMAADTQGTTRYTGFVVGVRVDPLDIRPAITLTAPVHDTPITYLAEVRGSITSRSELREWFVEYAPLAQVNLEHLADAAPSWIRLNRGTAPVSDGVLATFDPTVLPNDAYVIRVSAWNRNGLGWAESVVVQVTGHAKLGNFAIEFTDLQLPLAGVPITLKRVYDSLNASRSGDFGHGWSLALQEADIAETVPQSGSGLGSTPFRVGTRVYLTAPDGQRLGFTLEPEVGAVSFLGAAYRAVFKPDPGIRYRLEVPEGDAAFLSVRPNGDLAFFFLPFPWNPDTYVLTDTAGTRYTYDQEEGLIEIRDPSGNRVSFTATAITHSAGPEVRLTRDGAGRITEVVAPDGQRWRYHYDDGGDLVQVTYPGGLVATFGYAAHRPHFLETIDNPWSGPSLRTEYDANGRVAALVDAAGNRREQHWDPGSFTGTFTDARGNVTKLIYDARGNVTRREDPLGGVTTGEYKNPDHPDLQTAIIDPRGHRTSYTYDARGNRTTLTPPGRRQETYRYDDEDRVIEAGYRTGGREEFGYDGQGQLIRYQRNLPRGEWTFTYTANGALASMLDPKGGLTRLEYDHAFGLPSRIIAPDGGAQHFRYDAAGRLVESTDPLGGITRHEYDALGRLVRQVDPAGAEIRTTYDTVFPREPATVTDRTGRVTRYAYDALGRVAQVTAPGGAITRYEYDADGNRTAVVDPLGNRHEFAYDALGRLTVETDPLGRQRLHTYDLAGNRTEATDRNGRRRLFAYDEVNLLTEERWLDPATDEVVRTIQYTYDALDRMRSATDPESVIEWFWSPMPGSSLDNERARYAGLPERRIASTYDPAGRRERLNAATGTVGAWSLAFTHDTSGRLRIVTSRPELSGAVTGNAWQLQLWRNVRGDLTELRRFSDQHGEHQVSQTFLKYNDPCACWRERIEHVVATNQPMPEATLEFTRDPQGDITGIQDGDDRLAFAYDAAAQLTNVTRQGVVAERYTYDVSGNRTSSHRHAAYTTGPGNRLTTAGPWHLAYDPEGNLLTKSNSLTGVAFTYTWDHRSRLTHVRRDDPGPPSVSEVTEHRYDAVDRRIAVIRGGTTNWTYYDRLQPLMDYADADTVPAALYFSGEPLDDLQAVWRRDQGAFWTLTDHLGTVRWLLNATNGFPVATRDFDRFGNPTSATGTEPAPTGRFGFAGREWDTNTGLYYNRARYYDPDLGRFISEDPIGFAGGDPNLYRYVNNNPLNGTDPLGLSEASESGVLKLPSQIAREAICEAGAEVASVYISAAVSVPSVYVSAAVEVSASVACRPKGVAGRPRHPPLTPEEKRLNALLELPPPPPVKPEPTYFERWLATLKFPKSKPRRRSEGRSRHA